MSDEMAAPPDANSAPRPRRVLDETIINTGQMPAITVPAPSDIVAPVQNPVGGVFDSVFVPSSGRPVPVQSPDDWPTQQLFIPDSVIPPPVGPVIAAPVEPVVAHPVEPVIAAPAEPVVAALVEPVVAPPVEPVIAAPTEPAVAAPVEPAPMAPVDPVPTPVDTTPWPAEPGYSFFDDEPDEPDEQTSRIGATISAERDEPPTLARSIVAFVFVGLLAASLAVLVLVLVRMNVLSTGLLVTAATLDGMLGAALAGLLLSSRIAARQTRYVVGIMISLLLILVNSTVAYVGNGYNRMIQNIQPPVEDTVVYDVIGLMSGPSSVAGLANTEMGFDGTDHNQDAVRQGVNDLVSGVTFVVADDWSTAVNNLLTGEYTSVVIQDGYWQIFSDADATDFAKVQVLWTFEVPGASTMPGGTFTPRPPASVDQPFIVYISGIDTAGPIASRSRSDVNQLMVVNPQTGNVLLVNTPRDFYVTLADMPNCDLPDKLTHAGVYGINVSVDTLNALYGIDINYYVRLNFSSLVTVVDALGGIDVDSQWAFTASQGACQDLDSCPSFTVGMNHLDGVHALAFARERHNVPGGDRGRGADQQAVITAILKKATQPSSLMNYAGIVSAISGSIQTSMTPDQISAQVKRQISTGTNWTVKSMSVTGADMSNYTCSYPHQKLYVMNPDQKSLAAAKDAIRAVLNGD
ncbi:MAG: LCP family protein [Propionibacteriaceae bacterium]|nr:LCP family protein [Propionibacteriaceae bacterium]